MRVEEINGRFLLCGGMIPNSSIKPGQTWAPADGSKRSITIESVKEDWVKYSWDQDNEYKTHQKLCFAFQCRYCLVLPTKSIPEEFDV